MFMRLLGAMPAALLAVLGLVFSMQALTANGETNTVTIIDTWPLGYPTYSDTSELIVDRWACEIRPAPEWPETTSRQEISIDEFIYSAVEIPMPNIPYTDPVTGLTPSDTPLVVAMQARPRLPAVMAKLGIEGYVDVTFDVLPSGAVTNVEVVDASHPGFRRAAVDAAHQLRYSPRLSDGMPQTAKGLRYRFRFEFDN